MKTNLDILRLDSEFSAYFLFHPNISTHIFLQTNNLCKSNICLINTLIDNLYFYILERLKLFFNDKKTLFY